ncbi:hypothetical protein ACFE04_025946 [Oxalis oulophora]
MGYYDCEWSLPIEERFNDRVRVSWIMLYYMKGALMSSSSYSSTYNTIDLSSEYYNIRLEDLKFVCYCNEPALIISSEMHDNGGRTVVTCKKYNENHYGCNMWEWFENNIPRRHWIADMYEREQRRLLNNSRYGMPLSMYKGRRYDGRPVCLCDKPCSYLGPSIVTQDVSSYFYFCGDYYQSTEDKCCIMIPFGEYSEPNFTSIMVVKLKTELDKEIEEHLATACMIEGLKDANKALKLENEAMKAKFNNRKKLVLNN